MPKYVNDVGFENQTNVNDEIIACKKRVKEMNELHLNYVDDLTLAEAISMNTQLCQISAQERPQPDAYISHVESCLLSHL